MFINGILTLISNCPDRVCGFKQAYNVQANDIIINETHNAIKNKLVLDEEEFVSKKIKNKSDIEKVISVNLIIKI